MAKFPAKGTSISYLVGSTYTAIAQCKSVSFDLGGAPAKINANAHDDATNIAQYVSGRSEPGSVQLEIVYDPGQASHAWLRGAQGATHTFRVALPDTGAATETFSASVGGLQIDADNEGLLVARCTLEILGASTHAA